MYNLYAERRLMRKFDYSFLKNALLPAGLLNISSGIADLKNEAKHRKQDYVKVFTELEAVARIQAMKE